MFEMPSPEITVQFPGGPAWLGGATPSTPVSSRHRRSGRASDEAAWRFLRDEVGDPISRPVARNGGVMAGSAHPIGQQEPLREVAGVASVGLPRPGPRPPCPRRASIRSRSGAGAGRSPRARTSAAAPSRTGDVAGRRPDPLGHRGRCLQRICHGVQHAQLPTRPHGVGGHRGGPVDIAALAGAPGQQARGRTAGCGRCPAPPPRPRPRCRARWRRRGRRPRERRRSRRSAGRRGRSSGPRPAGPSSRSR